MNGAALNAEAYVATVSDTIYRIMAVGDHNSDATTDLL